MSAVGDTTETTQMYLRTVLELELAGIPALRARLVERLHHSAPAVSQTVAKLAGDGLLELNEPDRTLSLTDDRSPGRQQRAEQARARRADADPADRARPRGAPTPRPATGST